MINVSELSRGSTWHRWDPHIHAPGTALEDQFSGPNAWDSYFERIETAVPTIKALGITDYYSVDLYETVREQKKRGRLSNIDLLFPNIEMRYGVGTSSSGVVNVHLLISPEDEDHVDQTRRLLGHLAYTVLGDTFHCTRTDLIRLGRKHAGGSLDDQAAYKAGVNQFKVSPEGLLSELQSNEWMRANVLIAVVAGSRDGTSGVQEGDASLASLRAELERRSHVIFGAQPKLVDFWLGRGSASRQELLQRWGGPKPCIHGSDAHKLDDVGNPDRDRFCWLKGSVTFDTLRQTSLEPSRAHIGPEPPRGALPSQAMTSVRVREGDWFVPNEVPLNSGMVAIIGARGSGKTALADVIAAATDGLGTVSDRSFLARAQRLLRDELGEVIWDNGEVSEASLAEAVTQDRRTGGPHVQYLSQQFVDQLCSAERVTDELLEELERVVFQSHAVDERFGCQSFRELLNFRTELIRSHRARQEDAIRAFTEELSTERDLAAARPDLEKRAKDVKASLEKDKAARTALLKTAALGDAQQLNAVIASIDRKTVGVDRLRRRRQSLVGLQREASDFRSRSGPAIWEQLKDKYSESGLQEAEWDAFRTDFRGDVDALVTKALAATDRELKASVGEAITPTEAASPSKTTLLKPDIAMDDQPLRLLEAERERLQALMGIDSENAKVLGRLTERITQQEGALAQLERELERAKSSSERQTSLIQQRNDAYQEVFEAIKEEQAELVRLYSPLGERLQGASGPMGKLSFEIRREVDMGAWAETGESLLDLRKIGPFKGHGGLLAATREAMEGPWSKGSSEDVARAMAEFRAAHDRALLDQANADRMDKPAWRAWLTRLSAWLYSTDHIKVVYSIQYDGANIEELSPGTRGIVLLILYLAIDDEDDRPLIIDQPEENLDPKSVFDELVELFRTARGRRQVIIVTHNANLVVNTDVEQVIVAQCGPHRPGQLPQIDYFSGGLEDAAIREHVCEILEGGEDAFRERARRLRLAAGFAPTQ